MWAAVIAEVAARGKGHRFNMHHVLQTGPHNRLKAGLFRRAMESHKVTRLSKTTQPILLTFSELPSFWISNDRVLAFGPAWTVACLLPISTICGVDGLLTTAMPQREQQ